MLTHDGTYMIRCWNRGKDTCRVEVIHVQTGERALLSSTAAALAWIDSSDRGHGDSTPESTPATH